MFLKGINYDVGTYFVEGKPTRPAFEDAVIRKELEIIRNELHCDAIRISGYDIGRLSTASGIALSLGLQVWFSPACINATTEEAENYLILCAGAAEKLREKYKDILFVIGCEYSLFLKGFMKGDTLGERLKRMFNPFGILFNILGLRKPVDNKLNKFLREVSGKVREHFKGSLTYASGTWEKVDWKIFDVVGIDHYRATFNKSTYQKQLTGYYKFNKPVAVLEFGCCTYKGAEDKGGAGWTIVGTEDGKPVIKGDYIRDETVQAEYITELLDLNRKRYLQPLSLPLLTRCTNIATIRIWTLTWRVTELSNRWITRKRAPTRIYPGFRRKPSVVCRNTIKKQIQHEAIAT